MRKILNNYNKSNRVSGTRKGKIGTPLNIQDKNGFYLCVGDKIKYGECEGVLLYNNETKMYVVALDYSMWYGNLVYDIKSYGKCIDLPLDNGAKMKIERIGVT